MAYGASMMNTSSVGSGTTTPGAAVDVKGAGLFDGFVGANYFTSTSSLTSWVMGQVGIGTTTPGAQLAVDGVGLFNGGVTGDFLVATSTTATSTIRTSIEVASSSLQVSGFSGQVVIGATTTLSNADVIGRDLNPDPALTITGVGNAAGATGTLYVSGGGTNGGEIIIRSSDGFNCVSLTVLSGNVDPFVSNIALATLLNAKIVACPR